MAPFGKFPSQAFIHWDFYHEVADKRFPFWRIAAEGIFEDFTIQYDPENGENWILIPYTQVEGTGTRRPFAAADSDVEIPILSVAGFSGGSGSIQLFPLHLSGFGLDGGYGNLSISFTVNGFGYTYEKGNGDLTIPFIQVTALQGVLGDITLYPLVVSGYGFSGQHGNGSFVLPFVLLEEGQGKHNCVGVGNFSLPVQQLFGVGVSSVGTVGAVGDANLIIGTIRVSGLSYTRIVESIDVVLNYESKRRYT